MPPRRLDVSDDAKRDLDDIAEYSIRTWGDEQAAHYAESITNALELLLEFPLLGQDREDIAPGLRSQLLAHHLVLYRVYVDSVRIARVIHHREDIREVVIEPIE